MPLISEEYNEVMQHFLSLVREHDPVGFERLMQFVSRGPDRPRDSLLHAVAMYHELGSYRTVGTHAQILERLNEHVRTEGGDQIQSIQVSLTPEEQRLFQRDALAGCGKTLVHGVSEALLG